MSLEEIRDYIAELGIADSVYMSKMPGKAQQTIGVYPSNRSDAYRTAIGGKHLKSYGVYYVSLLVHWNEYFRQTEAAAKALFNRLELAREEQAGEHTIKFIQLMYDRPVYVGTDDDGNHEMVVEAAIVYERRAE